MVMESCALYGLFFFNLFLVYLSYKLSAALLNAGFICWLWLLPESNGNLMSFNHTRSPYLRQRAAYQPFFRLIKFIMRKKTRYVRNLVWSARESNPAHLPCKGKSPALEHCTPKEWRKVEELFFINNGIEPFTLSAYNLCSTYELIERSISSVTITLNKYNLWIMKVCMYYLKSNFFLLLFT